MSNRRRFRLAPSTSGITSTFRFLLALALLVSSSAVGFADQSKVQEAATASEAQQLPDEVSPLTAQPAGPAIANPNPLGQREMRDASAISAPFAAITCNGAGGLWSNAGSWTGGVPTASDSVTITTGCTIVIDTAAVAQSVVVQTGGILEYDSVAAQALVVGQSVTIDAGGTFRTPAAGTVTTHGLAVGTDLTNNGTLDFSTNSDTAGAGITFTGVGNATFGGAGATTDLRTLTINKGASFANTLEVTTSNLSVQGTTVDGTPMGFVTLTNGTLKISGSFTMSSRLFGVAAYTIPATGGIWLNNPNFTVSGQNGSPTNNGLFRVSTGTYNIGTSSGNALGGGTGSSFIISGGTVNTTGRINSASTLITYAQSGGVVNVCTIGCATAPSFGFTGTGTVVIYSGGTVNLVQANTAVTPVDYNMGGTMNFTGGTLNVGTAATATNFTFRVQGQIPELVVDNTTNNKNVNLSGQANVWGNLTIPVGSNLNLNPGTAQTLLMIGPSLVNNGAIVVNTNNTGTVNFAAALQPLIAPYAQTYAGTGTFGTVALRIGTVSLQNPLGATIDPGVSALNIYRTNIFFGPFTNSNKFAMGNADATAVIVQRGSTGNPFAAGSLDVAPTFNIGAGGITLVYAQSQSAITTGPEVPVSRSVNSFQISNPTGVTVAGGAITCTAATNCLALGGGPLNTDVVNLFTIANTVTGSLAGGSGLSYVNGPLARTLPASLAAGATYTFPVGKSAFKMLELVTPTTTAGGSVVVQVEVFDANSGGTAGTGFSSINTNRYWSAQVTSGGANFTSAAIRLTEQGTVGINAIGQSATQAGAYDSIGGAVAPPTIGPSSVVTSLNFFAVGTLTGSNTICGNHNVGAAGAYLTLTAAVADLNAKLMSCAVTFTLTDNVYAGETYPITIQPNGGSSATNTLTIKPAVGATPAFAGSSASALIVLNGADWVTIDGSNTVGGTTRNLSIQNTNAGTSSAVIWGQSVGTSDSATNNTIKNVSISGNASTTTLIGVGFGSSTIAITSVGTRNNNNVVQNNLVVSTQVGIFSQGASTLLKNTGTVITGNSVGGSGALALGRCGILVGFDDGVQVTNNTINGVGPFALTGFVDGCGIGLGTSSFSNTAFGTNNDVANVVVTGNVIGPVVKTDTSSAAGIVMANSSYGTSLVANNSIWGVVGNGTAGDFAVGMLIGNVGTSNATTQVYYNSISMVGNRDTGGASSQPAFALAIIGANPKVDLRNNSLYNISTAAAATAGSYAIGITSTVPLTNFTSNYNDLFTSGTSSRFSMFGSLVNVAFDQTTLAAWQAATGKDANSISVDPTYSSSTNLQPLPGSPLVAAGTPVSVLVDILGVVRNGTNPTIGAYETAADNAGPVITYTPLINTTSTANRTLSITATDFSGVPTAGPGLPVLYYRKGLVGAFTANQCSHTGGSGYDCVFNYGLLGGVSTGDTIQYYVAAQDNINNVATNPSAGAGSFTANPPAAGVPPTTPNSYLISSPVTGTLTVCASGCGFTTLTGAGGLFAALNAGVATGNIVVEINSDLIVGEDGSVALNELTEEPAGSNFTMTFYPTGAPRAITSTTAPTGGFIRLNGADRVTIDGSLGGGGTDRSLTITDTNTGTASAVIQLQSGTNGSSGNTLKNLVVVGNSNTTTFFGIAAGGAAVASLGADNDNNRIENCDIRRAQFGIATQGASAANKDTGTVITKNVMTSTGANSLGKGGIIASFEDGIQITQNSIGNIDSAASNDVLGISLGGLIGYSNTTITGGSEVTNATVTRNSIGIVRQSNTFGAVGILVTPTTTGTNLIANNFVSGVQANGTSADFGVGIFIVDSGTDSTTQLYANSVSMTGTQTGANERQFALAVNGTNPTLDVKDNILFNTQTTGATNISYAVGLGYSTFTNLTSDFNDLFVTATGNFRVGRTGSITGTGGTDATTLADWQTATGKDANSVSVDPLFVSATDLHLTGASPVRSAGTPLVQVTVDIDGDPRDATSPSIGADEVLSTDVSITKTDGVVTAVPGGSVTYTITASNDGSNAATATVTDNFPAAITSCSTTCVGSGGTCAAGPVAGNLSDSITLTAGGSVTYTAVCNVSPAASGSLVNTASVALTGTVYDNDTSNNSATDTDTLTASADLAISKSDGLSTEIPGTSVTYSIIVNNNGPSDVGSATVADVFPGTLSGCSTTCTPSGTATCTAGPVAGDINDSVSLPAGTSVTYSSTCNISAAATGNLVNTATVNSAVTDGTPENNSATDTDTLSPQADLSITKTDGVLTATPGETVTYTIVAANAGPSNAPGSTVTDDFVAALSCSTTCVGSDGGTCTAGPVLTDLNDSVNLPAGGSVTYTAVCDIDGGATGSLINTATVTAAGTVTDPTPGNNSSTDTDTLALEADLSISKDDGVTVVAAGTDTTYTITASNAGPSAAPAAAVFDDFPADCTSVSWTCTGSDGGSCVAAGTGDINQSVNLPSGASVTFLAVCSIDAEATGTLTNTAFIGLGVNDPDDANNSSTDVDTIGEVPIFSDGFESGDTSAWSDEVPFAEFEVFAWIDVDQASAEATFGYDLASVRPGRSLDARAIVELASAGGDTVARLVARRIDASSPLELRLEVVGGAQSGWVVADLQTQSIRIDWATANATSLGSMASTFDGVLTIWVDGFEPAGAPVVVKLLRERIAQ